MLLVIDEEATSDYVVSGLAIDNVLHEIRCDRKPRRGRKIQIMGTPVSIP
jgi:hypothetical protein